MKKYYTVYDRRDPDDFPLCVSVPAEEAAELMGLTLESFYCAVSRQGDRRNPWIIYSYKSEFDEDGEEQDIWRENDGTDGRT